MNKITTGLFLALLLGVASCGKPAEPRAADMPKSPMEKPAIAMNVSDPNVVKISVPTMECETCAKAIKKGLSTVPEAQNVDVDVDSKTVFVKVANNTPETQAKLEQAIAKTGYSTTKVQRDPAAFKSLPSCCKVGGEKKESM